MLGGVFRFLDHIKNEDSPGPTVGSHHTFFSDDQEPYPVTDIVDLIRDSYEVTGPCPISTHPVEACWGDGLEGGFRGCFLCPVYTEGIL